jgi:hypothetical protein
MKTVILNDEQAELAYAIISSKLGKQDYTDKLKTCRKYKWTWIDWLSDEWNEAKRRAEEVMKELEEKGIYFKTGNGSGGWGPERTYLVIHTRTDWRGWVTK